MRVLICGMDGYLGWPLAVRLLGEEGFEVIGLDNFSRRQLVREVGSASAIPIPSMDERLAAAREAFGEAPLFYQGDLRDYDFVAKILEEHRPDAIVHLGEMPSAPFSMADAKRAYFTQENNVLGTLNLLFAMRDHSPRAHLVKLGTMGEYGTPNLDIPEGFFEVEFNGRKDRLPFPRQPGSLYHLSKVHDSFNIMFACRVWNLTSTDVMQGVVYGTSTDEMEDLVDMRTRFDFDETFGTAINRFCAQAIIGHPLTVYGAGRQKRGFIALRDSIQCLMLAVKNPAEKGEYRVFNQFDEVYSLQQLADVVASVAESFGLHPTVESVENPRVEAEDHYYNPIAKELGNLGFRPTKSLKRELAVMLSDIMPFRNRIEKFLASIPPRTRWNPMKNSS